MSNPIESAAQARADLAAKILADLNSLSAMFPVEGDERDQGRRGEGHVDDAITVARKAAIATREHADRVAARAKVAP